MITVFVTQNLDVDTSPATLVPRCHAATNTRPVRPQVPNRPAPLRMPCAPCAPNHPSFYPLCRASCRSTPRNLILVATDSECS